MTEAKTEQMTGELRQRLHQLVTRAREDDAFKARLIADPMVALKEAGIAVPEGVVVRVLENTEGQLHLVLPQPGQSDALPDAALEGVVGGLMRLGRGFGAPSQDQAATAPGTPSVKTDVMYV